MAEETKRIGRPPTKFFTEEASLDRVDNSIGYTIANTRIICFKCNCQKSAATPSDIENMYNYVNKKPPLNSDFLLWI
jgi:hypothetical protein